MRKYNIILDIESSGFNIRSHRKWIDSEEHYESLATTEHLDINFRTFFGFILDENFNRIGEITDLDTFIDLFIIPGRIESISGFNIFFDIYLILWRMNYIINIEDPLLYFDEVEVYCLQKTFINIEDKISIYTPLVEVYKIYTGQQFKLETHIAKNDTICSYHLMKRLILDNKPLSSIDLLFYDS